MAFSELLQNLDAIPLAFIHSEDKPPVTFAGIESFSEISTHFWSVFPEESYLMMAIYYDFTGDCRAPRAYSAWLSGLGKKFECRFGDVFPGQPPCFAIVPAGYRYGLHMDKAAFLGALARAMNLNQYKKAKSHTKNRLGYLHIRKCAGTATGDFIHRFYYGGEPSLISHREGESGDAPERMKAAMFYWGHYDYDSLRAVVPQETKVVTFMRDPKKRLRSHYNYSRSRTWNYVDRTGSIACALAKTCDLQIFLQSPSIHVWPTNDNHMTRMLAGARVFNTGGTMDRALEVAKENLHRLFHVGFVETYDDSMTALCDKLLIPPPPNGYERQNVGEDKGTALSNSDVDALAERTVYDQLLYDYARECF